MLQRKEQHSDFVQDILTLWFLNQPKQASTKSAVFSEPAKTGQITISFKIKYSFDQINIYDSTTISCVSFDD